MPLTHLRVCRLLVSLLSAAPCAPVFAQAPATTLTFAPGTSVKVEQLIGDEDYKTTLPTVSRTLSRYKVLATDLGQSFEANGRLVFLFGDTITQDPNIVNGGTADTFARAPMAMRAC